MFELVLLVFMLYQVFWFYQDIYGMLIEFVLFNEVYFMEFFLILQCYGVRYL